MALKMHFTPWDWLGGSGPSDSYSWFFSESGLPSFSMAWLGRHTQTHAHVTSPDTIYCVWCPLNFPSGAWWMLPLAATSLFSLCTPLFPESMCLAQGTVPLF